MKRLALVLAACSSRGDPPAPRDPPRAAPPIDARSAEADVLARALDVDGHVPAALGRTPAPVATDVLHPTDDARRRALAGAWILRQHDTLIAFEFAGDRVRTWDGTEEKSFRIGLDECTLWLEAGRGGDGYDLGLRKGVAVFGMGSFGQRVGREAYACAAGTFRLDRAGRCTYASRAGDPHPARCALANDTFTYTDPSFHDEQSLQAVDDLLWSDQLAKEHAEPVVDYATAAAIVSNQPAAVAIHAGGKIGDTTTVAGLVATVAMGRAATIGRSVDVSGIVLDAASTETNGEQAYYVDLHTPKDFFHPGVACFTKSSPLGTVHPDQVVRVRGRVEKIDADGDVTLRPCALLP